jgi:hypothetical protein
VVASGPGGFAHVKGGLVEFRTDLTLALAKNRNPIPQSSIPQPSHYSDWRSLLVTHIKPSCSMWRRHCWSMVVAHSASDTTMVIIIMYLNITSVIYWYYTYKVFCDEKTRLSWLLARTILSLIDDSHSSTEKIIICWFGAPLSHLVFCTPINSDLYLLFSWYWLHWMWPVQNFDITVSKSRPFFIVKVVLKICASPCSRITFRNMLTFCGELSTTAHFLNWRTNPCRLSATAYTMFTATFFIWSPFLAFAIWRRALA